MRYLSFFASYQLNKQHYHGFVVEILFLSILDHFNQAPAFLIHTIISKKDLHASRDGKEILKEINLKTGLGEVHVMIDCNKFEKRSAFFQSS